MRNYLIFAGKDSRDFGVYISGQGTFSAPEKAYEFYSVPGRNGAILGNENRLENIEVSYECFIYSDFSKNIADFRTFLLSLNGYQRLSDSYHPDEYRKAVYVGAFEPDVTSKNDAGSFTLTFNCKPQRWLLSGDTVYSWVNGGAHEITGSEITVYSGRLDTSIFKWTYKRHTLDGQELTGTARTDWIAENSMKKIQVNFDGLSVLDYDYKSNNPYGANYTECTVDLIQGKILSGTRCAYGQMPVQGWTNYTQYVWSRSVSHDDFIGCSLFKRVYADNITDAIPLMSQYYFACYYDSTNKVLYIRLPMSSVNTSADVATVLGIYEVMWEFDDSYQIDFALNNWNYTPSFPEKDFFKVSDKYNKNYAEFYMEYSPANAMSNPTMFPSAPMIRAYGTGSFVMDGITVTISNCTNYVDIDCELMDCYEGSTNRNNAVSFSTYDFPKLRSGNNTISIVSGITALEITPRWWRV